MQWIWPPRSPSFTINLKSLWKVEPTETKTFKARPLPFPNFGQTPSPTPQHRACLLNKQLCCWLGVSIAALRRLYLLWSAATYPGSFTTPMQCQLIAVTSCNIEQLLASLNLWASPALCIWGQYVRRNYLMSEEKRDRDIFAQQWSHISYRQNKRILFIPPLLVPPPCWT